MRLTLMLLAVFVSLFCSNHAARAGGDAPKPLGSDVVWYQDTTGNSPFKKAFLGMWYVPDGKIVVPQGNQLFLVDPETGKVVEKKEVGFDIKGYCSANDRYLLASDTTLYIYDKATYKLIKQLEFPEEIAKLPKSAFYMGNKQTFLNRLSPDGKLVTVVYGIAETKDTGFDYIGQFNVETGKFEKIKEAFIFGGIFTPDGKYFISNEKVNAYSNTEPVRPVIYDPELKNVIYDVWKTTPSRPSNYSFSADSKTFYYSSMSNFYSIRLEDNFKLDTITIKNCIVGKVNGINDTLNWVFYYQYNDMYPTNAIMNLKNKSVVFKFNANAYGVNCFVATSKKYLTMMNDHEFFRMNIPYELLTKTDEEIKTINNDFTLAPNPTYDQVIFNLYLEKDQELTYTINTIDGKTVKKEYLGKYGAGYAGGTIYLGDLISGSYTITFYGTDKIACGKISIVR